MLSLFLIMHYVIKTYGVEAQLQELLISAVVVGDWSGSHSRKGVPVIKSI
jgi:hypothetical protein